MVNKKTGNDFNIVIGVSKDGIPVGFANAQSIHVTCIHMYYPYIRMNIVPAIKADRLEVKVPVVLQTELGKYRLFLSYTVGTKRYAVDECDVFQLVTTSWMGEVDNGDITVNMDVKIETEAGAKPSDYEIAVLMDGFTGTYQDWLNGSTGSGGGTGGDVDLSDYYTKAEVNKELIKKVSVVAGKSLSSNDYSNDDKAEVSKIKDKIDVEVGKWLSSNDYTNEEKEKLSLLQSVDTYGKTEIDAKIEEARTSLNLTDEQLSKLNINLTPIQNELKEINLFPIKDKKVLFIGDSLSSASGGSMESPAVGSWCKYTKSLLKLSDASRVIAVGGASCTDRNDTVINLDHSNYGGSDNVLSNQVYQVINHYKTYKGTENEFVPDMIMIMIGTNNTGTKYPDTMWNTVVGDWATCMYSQFSDKDFDLYDLTDNAQTQKYNALRAKRTKFYAAYRWAIEALLYWFPNTSIYVLSPMANGEGRGMNIYENTVPAVKKVADFLSCGYIDVFERSGLSYYTNTRKGNGWDSYWYTFDGTHPNFAAGMELVGRYVAVELLRSYFVKPPISAIKVPMEDSDIYYTINIVNANADISYGTTNPVESQIIIKGSLLTVNIIPATGYSIYSVKVDGVGKGGVSTYTFSDVQSNHEIIVEFSRETAPALNSIQINSGGTVAYDRNVLVGINATGSFTHYMISENSDFSGTDWTSGSTSNINFMLSNGYDSKTVFAKIKNYVGESVTKSATISYQETPAVTYTVTGRSNNASYGTVTPASQTVADGASATVNAQAQENCVIESWTDTDSSTGIGEMTGTATVSNIKANKTITCNFKQNGVTPPEPSNKTILSFGWTYDDHETVEDGITKIWIPSNVMNVQTPVGVLNLNGKGVTNYAPLIGATTGNNSGIYPDKFLERGFYITGNNTSDLSGDITISGMVNGTYKISLLNNISSKAQWASYIADPSIVTIDVNGVSKNPIKIKDNTDTLTVFENRVISDGVLRIQTTINVKDKRLMFNIIQIEKIS